MSISSKDPPSSSFQQPKSPPPSSSSDEADLAELVTSILSTSEKVAAVVQELERGREERRKDPTSPQDPLDDSFDAYMKVMKTLQFGEFMPTDPPLSDPLLERKERISSILCTPVGFQLQQ